MLFAARVFWWACVEEMFPVRGARSEVEMGSSSSSSVAVEHDGQRDVGSRRRKGRIGTIIGIDQIVFDHGSIVVFVGVG